MNPVNDESLHKVFNAINKDKDAPLDKMMGGSFRLDHSILMWTISDPLKLAYKQGRQ